MAVNNDPFAAAVEAAERGNFYYGSVQVSAIFVVLQKGVGKRTYIEGEHEPKDRCTEITITLNPIEQSGLTQLVIRSFIAESAEFARIVWPSLRDACGLGQLRDLDGKFGKVETVKNGRKWNDKKTGEEREGTTFKFHTLYSSQEDCAKAYEADGNVSRTATSAPAATVAADPMTIDMTANANNPERETAKMFLDTLAKQANGNKDALAQIITSTPLISKYFSLNSPEVAALMAA